MPSCSKECLRGPSFWRTEKPSLYSERHREVAGVEGTNTFARVHDLFACLVLYIVVELKENERENVDNTFCFVRHAV